MCFLSGGTDVAPFDVLSLEDRLLLNVARPPYRWGFFSIPFYPFDLRDPRPRAELIISMRSPLFPDAAAPFYVFHFHPKPSLASRFPENFTFWYLHPPPPDNAPHTLCFFVSLNFFFPGSVRVSPPGTPPSGPPLSASLTRNFTVFPPCAVPVRLSIPPS